MKLLLAIALSAAFLCTGTAAATQGVPVLYGPYDSVTIAPTFAGVVGLTINTPRWGYGALTTKDYTGQVATSIDANGTIWSHDTGSDTPRLILSAPGAGYSAADAMQVIIGSTPVTTISANGEVEAYSYYVWPDTPRLSVRDGQDNLKGGIAAGGALITAQNIPPDPRDMANGEAREWFDPTPGTGGLMVTMKDSAGGVKTIRLNGS